MFRQALCVGAVAVAIGAVPAAAATVSVTISPVQDARQLKMMAPLGDETLVDPVAAETTRVTLPPSGRPLPERRSLFVRWSDGSQTNFRIVLTSTLGEEVFQIYFFRPPAATDEPSEAEVRRDCNIGTPGSIEEAFRVYHLCRAHTLALAESSTWDPTFRLALSGWFTANYFLYTRTQPLSPYGFDSDLAGWLRQAVELVESQTFRAQRMKPLRIADIRQALRDLDSESIRAAGLVPTLVQEGQLTAADIINRAALEAFDATGTVSMVAQYGIDRNVLTGNQLLIDNLLERSPNM